MLGYLQANDWARPGGAPPGTCRSPLPEEHDEDLARLGGYLRATASARAASVESVPRRLWHRLPRLAVGLAGAMIAAGLMAAFDGQLEANLLAAFFVPGIVYLADAVGTVRGSFGSGWPQLPTQHCEYCVMEDGLGRRHDEGIGDGCV